MNGGSWVAGSSVVIPTVKPVEDLMTPRSLDSITLDTGALSFGAQGSMGLLGTTSGPRQEKGHRGRSDHSHNNSKVGNLEVGKISKSGKVTFTVPTADGVAQQPIRTSLSLLPKSTDFSSIPRLVIDGKYDQHYPIHRSSGEMSVSVNSVGVSGYGGDHPAAMDSAYDYQHQSFWGSGYWDTIEGREQIQKELKEEQEQEQREKEAASLAKEAKLMEREALLKAKVINTLFNKNISMDVVNRTIKRALNRKRRERAAAGNSRGGEQPLTDAELDEESELEHQVSLLVEQQLQTLDLSRDPTRPNTADYATATENNQYSQFVSASPAAATAATGTGHSASVPILPIQPTPLSLQHGQSLQETDDLSSLGSLQTSSQVDSPLHSQSHAAATGADTAAATHALSMAIQDQVPKFRSAAHQEREKETQRLLDEQRQKGQFVNGMEHALGELSASRARDKLRNLSSFIHGHTARKICSHWNMLESRFKASHHFTFATVTDRDTGLSHQKRVHCLYPSSLYFLLCSNRVKVGFQELNSILQQIGVSPRGLRLGRLIAALNQTLHACGDLRQELTTSLKSQLQLLIDKEKELVSINQLIDTIMSKDPQEQEQKLTELRANRQNEVALLMDDKKKREEYKIQQEKRRVKLVDDFEKILDQIQLYKSTLTKTRLDQFLAIIAQCDRVVCETREDITSKIPTDVVFFLGVDAFPEELQEPLFERQRRKGMTSKPGLGSGPPPLQSQDSIASITSIHSQESQRTTHTTSSVAPPTFTNFFEPEVAPADSVTRAKLRGPPHIVTTMRDMVRLGKTFPGLSYREAVEITQYIAASKIAAAGRGFNRRWRYNAARNKWKSIFRRRMSNAFGDWKHTVFLILEMRKRVLRKVIAWRFFTVRCQQRRECFRVAFWPFYVWRRMAVRERVAKEKARFLVGRVIPTLTTMKIFRAWRDEIREQTRKNRITQRCLQITADRRRAVAWQWWRWWARKRNRIRRAWHRRGSGLRRDRGQMRTRELFLCWRYFALIRPLARARVHNVSLASALRAQLVHDRPPLLRLSLASRRILFSSKRMQAVPVLNKKSGQGKRKSTTHGSGVISVNSAGGNNSISNGPVHTGLMASAMRTSGDLLNAMQSLSISTSASLVGTAKSNSSTPTNAANHSFSVEDMAAERASRGSVIGAQAKRKSVLNVVSHNRIMKPVERTDAQIEGLGLALDECQKRGKRKHFRWIRDWRSYWDAESDEEDEIDVPLTLRIAYIHAIDAPSIERQFPDREAIVQRMIDKSNYLQAGKLTLLPQTAEDIEQEKLRQAELDAECSRVRVDLSKDSLPVNVIPSSLESADNRSTNSRQNRHRKNSFSKQSDKQSTTEREKGRDKTQRQRRASSASIESMDSLSEAEAEGDDEGKTAAGDKDDISVAMSSAAGASVAIDEIDEEMEHNEPSQSEAQAVALRNPMVLTQAQSSSSKVTEAALSSYNRYLSHRFASMTYMYAIRDVWNLLESAMRFHRFGRLCFQNLRAFAIQKKRVKEYQRIRGLQTKRSLFLEWTRFVTRRRNILLESAVHGSVFDDEEDILSGQMMPSGTAMLTGGGGTGADGSATLMSPRQQQQHMQRMRERNKQLNCELLTQKLKQLHSQKFHRLKKLKEVLKQLELANQKSANYESDDEERANKAMKSLNLIDEDDDAYWAQLEKEQLARRATIRRFEASERERERQLQLTSADGVDGHSASTGVSAANSRPSTSHSGINGNTAAAAGAALTTRNHWQSMSVGVPNSDLRSQSIPAHVSQVDNDELPNLLAMDRADREGELQIIEDMLLFAMRALRVSRQRIDTADTQVQISQSRTVAREGMVKELLDAEGKITQSATTLQRDYAIHFREHAADILLTVLASVHEAVQTKLMMDESRIYFRALRLPMMIARSKHMLVRKQLINHIRICRRLIAISRRADHYHRIRTKWILFNKWLQHIEMLKLSVNPLMMQRLRRKLTIHPAFHDLLRSKGFTQRAYTSDDANSVEESNQLKSLSDYKVLFQRWKMYTQECYVFGLMTVNVLELYRLKVLRRCFFALKTRLTADDYYSLELRPQRYLSCMIRSVANLDQIVKRFVPLRRRQLPTSIRKRNRQAVQKMKIEGKTSQSFKRFSLYFQQQCNLRVGSEQRLLFEAFQARGTLMFRDVCHPLRKDVSSALVPAIMTKLDGKPFQDPHSLDFEIMQFHASHKKPTVLGQHKKTAQSSDETAQSLEVDDEEHTKIDPMELKQLTELHRKHQLPGGFRIHKIKFAVHVTGRDVNSSNGAGGNGNGGVSSVHTVLMGWQLVWIADGSRERESHQRGSWHSAGVSTQEIAVPKDDYIVGLEYLYDGPNIVGLRLKFFHAGFSRWIGGKTSLSTLSVSLNVEDFFDEREESIKQMKVQREQRKKQALQEILKTETRKERDHRELEELREERRQLELQRLRDKEARAPALPTRYVIGLTGLAHNKLVTGIGLVIRCADDQHVFSYHWVGDHLRQEVLDNELSERVAMSMSVEDSQAAGGQPQPQAITPVPPNIVLPSKGGANGNAGAGGAQSNGNPALGQLNASAAAPIDIAEGSEAQELNQESLTVSQFAPTDSKSGIHSTTGGDEEVDEWEAQFASDDESLVHRGERDGSQSEAPGGEGTDGQAGGDHTDNDNGSQGNASNKAKQSKRRLARQFARWQNGLDDEDVGEPLTSAETQFFDVLRMRLTELSAAKERAFDFAHRVWCDKEMHMNPALNRLMSLRVIAALTLWFYNSLAKGLGPLCKTEKDARQQLRKAKRLAVQAKTLQQRAAAMSHSARVLEASIQPWTGKPLLGPAERAAKRDHQQRIHDMKAQAEQMESTALTLTKESDELDQDGRSLLPRISLTLALYNNFKAKIMASRHKESLLERMSLEEIKNGLFGSNMKETLLNKHQMQAIHASLRDRKIALKDTTSLQRLVEDTLEEEERLLLQQDELRRVGMNMSLSSPPSRSSRRMTSSTAHLSLASSSRMTRSMASIDSSSTSVRSVPSRPTPQSQRESFPMLNIPSKQKSDSKSQSQKSLPKKLYSQSLQSPIQFSDDMSDVERARSPLTMQMSKSQPHLQQQQRSLSSSGAAGKKAHSSSGLQETLDRVAHRRPNSPKADPVVTLPPIGKPVKQILHVAVSSAEDDTKSLGHLSLSSETKPVTKSSKPKAKSKKAQMT